jgi:methyl-galactoside transport system substrate-binding protein
VVQASLVTGASQNGDLNGDGILSYAYITGPEDHLDAKLRSDGCAQALADAGVQAECLALEYTDWTREKGQQRCAAVLAKYGKDVEVIFCGNEELSLGAIDAIKDGGRTVGENVYLYGIGGENQSLMLIRSGDLSGTVSDDIPTQMRILLFAVQDLLAGKTPEDTGYVKHIAIDQTNVEDYID